jgi:precorrin-3B C17-methyltransferase
MSAGPAGVVSVVGIGPGDAGTCTPDVVDRVRRADDLVGYGPYLAMVAAAAGTAVPGADPGPRPEPEPPASAGPPPTVHASDNRQEADRARHALDLAAGGRRVAVVSSGDPGVFAMAAAVLEQLDADAAAPAPRWSAVEVEVLPGVTAAQAAAARVGAPLGHDFCVVSLSDNLKPWTVVERRLDAAAGADFVIALYNPVSRHRPWQLGRAIEIVARHRRPATPVVLGRDVGRPGESVTVVPLAELPGAPVDMRTVVVVGSSTTRCVPRPGNGTGAPLVYTPRSYPSV